MKIFEGADEERMEADIEDRIREMELPAYRFPGRFGVRDYIVAAAAAAVCLILILWGYFL